MIVALLCFIYGKRNKEIMDTINLLAEISILREKCEKYENALRGIHDEIWGLVSANLSSGTTSSKAVMDIVNKHIMESEIKWEI